MIIVVVIMIIVIVNIVIISIVFVSTVILCHVSFLLSMITRLSGLRVYGLEIKPLPRDPMRDMWPGGFGSHVKFWHYACMIPTQGCT